MDKYWRNKTKQLIDASKNTIVTWLKIKKTLNLSGSVYIVQSLNPTNHVKPFELINEHSNKTSDCKELANILMTSLLHLLVI